MNVKNYSSGKARTSNLLIVRLTVRRASQLRHRGPMICRTGLFFLLRSWTVVEYSLIGAQLCFGYEWGIAGGIATALEPQLYQVCTVVLVYLGFLGRNGTRQVGADATAPQGQRSRQFSLDMFVHVRPCSSKYMVLFITRVG